MCALTLSTYVVPFTIVIRMFDNFDKYQELSRDNKKKEWRREIYIIFEGGLLVKFYLTFFHRTFPKTCSLQKDVVKSASPFFTSSCMKG